eukprot:355286-Chlamydomonas_euryale.AAC.4
MVSGATVCYSEQSYTSTSTCMFQAQHFGSLNRTSVLVENVKNPYMAVQLEAFQAGRRDIWSQPQATASVDCQQWLSRCAIPETRRGSTVTRLADKEL